MQRINGLEKKIGWYKLVGKISEPEIDQQYHYNSPPGANLRW